MLITTFSFCFCVSYRNIQTAGSAPPHRPKPNSFKITFVRPIIKPRRDRSTPLGWQPSSQTVRPKGRTGRVKMRKMSLRDPNPVLHPNAIRSIFQPRTKAPCLPKRRLPRQEACWLRPRLNLPERCLPRPRSDGTHFRTNWRAVPHLRRPFWGARRHRLLQPGHPPLNCRVQSTPSHHLQARSGWHRSSHPLRMRSVPILLHRKEWLPGRSGGGLLTILTRCWNRSEVGDVISSRCTSGSSGVL